MVEVTGIEPVSVNATTQTNYERSSRIVDTVIRHENLLITVCHQWFLMTMTC